MSVTLTESKAMRPFTSQWLLLSAKMNKEKKKKHSNSALTV